ncbi:MAG: hypothetical protein MI744_20825, partial [Pseudomonadales bacterium]|nr:hypothetical protein [Pseudomonadales bacterium]
IFKHPQEALTTSITQDLHCVNCSYNLRTLTSPQRCPECNHPIKDTLQQPYLCFAPLPYLKSLRFSLLNIIIGFVLLYAFLFRRNINKLIKQRS